MQSPDSFLREKTLHLITEGFYVDFCLDMLFTGSVILTIALCYICCTVHQYQQTLLYIFDHCFRLQTASSCFYRFIYLQYPGTKPLASGYTKRYLFVTKGYSQYFRIFTHISTPGYLSAMSNHFQLKSSEGCFRSYLTDFTHNKARAASSRRSTATRHALQPWFSLNHSCQH